MQSTKKNYLRTQSNENRIDITMLNTYIVNFKSIQNQIRMQALAHNTTIKLDIEHNLTSFKVMEARFDLNQTVMAIKENVQSRFGTSVAYMQIALKDIKGNLIANLTEDMKVLGSFGAQSGMVLHVNDTNPNSILKQIQSSEGVEKYVMSEEDYDKLPVNFRKWKQNQLKMFPEMFQQKKIVKTSEMDPDYLQELASSISVGSRCKLDNGARGEICFVGKVSDKGVGYFVGVRLDEPFGNGNGQVKGVKYFEADDKYGIFVRPNSLQIGDFPVLDIDDEL